MRWQLASAAFAALFSALGACGGDAGDPGPAGATITLTQTQAALIMSKVSQIAAVHSESGGE